MIQADATMKAADTRQFDQLIQQTAVANYVVKASDVGLPQSIVRTNYTDFAPRFGFAWRPIGRPGGDLSEAAG